MSIALALSIATQWGLLEEVQYELDHGASPEEALKEWDLLEVACLINEFDLVTI